MTTEPKKRGTSPLSPSQAADKIATALGELPLRIEEGRANAEAEARAALQTYIAKQLARVPEAQRDRVAAVLLALQTDMCGFDLAALAANDASRSDDVNADVVAGMGGDDVPAGARAMPEEQRERVARLTGKGRQ